MDIFRDEYGVCIDGDDGYQVLTRWECVKAAFALLWNACLPLPKPEPRKPSVPQSEWTRRILSESLRVLQSNPSFLAKVNADYSDKLKAGDTIRIRMPVAPLTRAELPPNCT